MKLMKLVLGFRMGKLEARVGIDRVSSSTSHSKSIVYGIADCLTINELR